MDYGKIILDNLLPLVVTIATPVILYFVHKWLAYLAEKHKFEVDASMGMEIDRIIMDGIRYAEEQGHKALKAKSTESTKKLEEATTFVTNELKRNKLPEIASDQLIKLIEARLNKTRPA